MEVDQESFEQFVLARTPVLLRFAFVLTADMALAEDLLQEALLKTHRRWQRVCETDRPEAYLRRVVINEYLSWRRLRRNSEAPIDHVPDQVSLDAVEATIVERDQLWRALATLPRRQRAVLVLRHYEDLPDEQIAHVLGCSQSTVRSLARRALNGLRNHGAVATVNRRAIR